MIRKLKVVFLFDIFIYVYRCDIAIQVSFAERISFYLEMYQLELSHKVMKLTFCHQQSLVFINIQKL